MKAQSAKQPKIEKTAGAKRVITVSDTMQDSYSYVRSEPLGSNFDPEFCPELTPAEMLQLGVFCGKYMTDCRDEFPSAWFLGQAGTWTP